MTRHELIWRAAYAGGYSAAFPAMVCWKLARGLCFGGKPGELRRRLQKRAARSTQHATWMIVEHVRESEPRLRRDNASLLQQLGVLSLPRPAAAG